MKKISSVLSIFFVLAMGPLAYADAVYLKNGSVMRGKIVEKNERFIVLKAGEGEDAVKATIYLEDIHRIESEEDFFDKLKFVPTRLYDEGAQRPVFTAPPTKDVDYVRRLVKGDIAAPVAGAGSISGFIRLPDTPVTESGNLYVYLLRDVGGGKFVPGSAMLYQKVPAGDILSTKVHCKGASLSEDKKPDFQITNLYYRKIPMKAASLILDIKNKSKIPIYSLLFEIFINDKKVLSGPLNLGSIGPLEEKEFDITSVYEAYRIRMLKKEFPQEPEKMLRFRIVWHNTGEVEFEKAILFF